MEAKRRVAALLVEILRELLIFLEGLGPRVSKLHRRERARIRIAPPVRGRVRGRNLTARRGPKGQHKFKRNRPRVRFNSGRSVLWQACPNGPQKGHPDLGEGRKVSGTFARSQHILTHWEKREHRITA